MPTGFLGGGGVCHGSSWLFLRGKQSETNSWRVPSIVKPMFELWSKLQLWLDPHAFLGSPTSRGSSLQTEKGPPEREISSSVLKTPSLCLWRIGSFSGYLFLVVLRRNERETTSWWVQSHTWTFRGSKILGVGQKTRVFGRWREKMPFGRKKRRRSYLFAPQSGMFACWSGIVACWSGIFAGRFGKIALHTQISCQKRP